MGIEDSTGLGYTTPDLQGMFIAGNEFNYAREHAEAIRTANAYNIVSASGKAVEKGFMNLSNYQVVDLLLGLEENDGHSLVAYKSFPLTLQQQLRGYVAQGGNMLVSGAYIGTDMDTEEEKQFLADILKVRLEGTNRDIDENMKGLGTTFECYRLLNEDHYAAQQTDILMPTNENAFPALVYSSGTSAGVAYQGSDYKAFIMGFPFECIKGKDTQAIIMRGILNFLTTK
jgi:hypothetical protein